MSVDANVAAVVTATLAFVISQTWKCLCVPATGKNPIFGKVFFDEERLSEVAIAANLTFCPGLLEAVHSPTPPDISFFKKTPSKSIGLWGVYNLVLEKAGCKPLVYIGEASDKRSGIPARWKVYNNPHSPSNRKVLPSKVKDALDDGYKIVHKGVLVWCPIPDAKNVPRFRLLNYSVEAMFSFLFWAMFPKSGDYQIASCCPWDRDAFTYGGLCSHSSLNDIMRADLKLSAKELEDLAAEADEAYRLQRKRIHKASKDRRKAADPVAWAQMQKADRDRIKAADPNYYTDHSRATYQRVKKETPHKISEWNATSYANVKADPVRYKARLEKTRAQAKDILARRKESKEFYCESCELPCRNKSALEKHMGSGKHATRVKALARGVTFNHRCGPCHYSGRTAQGLCEHRKSAKHKQNMRAAAIRGA